VTTSKRLLQPAWPATQIPLRSRPRPSSGAAAARRHRPNGEGGEATASSPLLCACVPLGRAHGVFVRRRIQYDGQPPSTGAKRWPRSTTAISAPAMEPPASHRISSWRVSRPVRFTRLRMESGMCWRSSQMRTRRRCDRSAIARPDLPAGTARAGPGRHWVAHRARAQRHRRVCRAAPDVIGRGEPGPGWPRGAVGCGPRSVGGDPGVDRRSDARHAPIAQPVAYQCRRRRPLLDVREQRPHRMAQAARNARDPSSGHPPSGRSITRLRRVEPSIR
jgi:hypothetical protein